MSHPLSRLTARHAAAALLFLLGPAATGRAATLRFAPSSYGVIETQSAVTVTLVLEASDCSGAPEVEESTVTVRAVERVPPSAAAGQDFRSASYVVPLGGVENSPISRVLESLVLDDAEREGPESFRLVLESAPSTIGCSDGPDVPLALDPAGATVTIDDPEDLTLQTVRFESAAVGVEEPASGTRSVEVLVLRSSAEGEAAVDFAVSAGTAESEDFVASTGTLTFAAGATRPNAPLLVEVRADADGDDETVVLELRNARRISGPIEVGLGTPSQAVLTIDDLPAPPTVRFAQARITLPEEEGIVVVEIRRDGDTSGAVSVAVTVAGGSATLGADFEVVADRVTLAAGESRATYRLRIREDTRVEDEETVVLQLGSPSGAELGNPSTVTLALVDDDQAGGLQAVGTPPTAARPEEVLEFRVRVTNAAGQSVQGATVVWTIEEAGAGAAFVDGSDRSQTDAEGVAAKRVRLGPGSGTFRLSARLLGQEAALVFTVEVERDLAEVVPPNDPGAVSVAQTIDEICSDPAERQGNPLCAYFAGLAAAQQAEALDELSGDELGSAGSVALSGVGDQLSNLGSRLAALRGGASRQPLGQLALLVGGKPVDLGKVTAAFAAHRRAANLDAAFQRQLAAAFGDQEEAVPPGAAAETAPHVPRLGVFLNGRISFGEQPDRSASGGEAGFDSETLGLTAGFDYRLRDALFFGVAGGLLSTGTDLSDDGGTLEAEGRSLSLFGLYQPGESLYVQATATYGENDYDMTRNLDLPLEGVRSARATTGGTQVALGLDVGLDRSWKTETLSSFVRLSWVEADLDGYRETGADPFNIEVEAQTLSSLLSELGLEWTHTASFGWGLLRPMLRLAYLHEHDDDRRLIRGRFLVDPQSDNQFSIPTNAPDRDFFNAGAGLIAQTLHGTVFLFYDRELGRSDLQVETVTIGVRQEF